MKLLWILICLSVVLTEVAVADEAAPDTSCISKISTAVRIGDRIKVVMTNEDTLGGRLTVVDQLNNTFKVGLVTAERVSETTVDLADMRYLSYGEKGHIRPGWLIGGFLFGGLAGHLFEFQVVDPGMGTRSPFENTLHRGAFWGAISGLAVGTVVSLMTRTEKRLVCE